MKVNGQHFRTIWLKPDDEAVVQLIDQRFLPHRFVIEEVRTVEQMATAIREMHVRGAGLIGASAGYGMYLAAIDAAAHPAAANVDEQLARARRLIDAMRHDYELINSDPHNLLRPWAMDPNRSGGDGTGRQTRRAPPVDR